MLRSLLMFGLTIGVLAALATSPATRPPKPSQRVLALAKTCQAQRGIAAEAFVHHLQRTPRGHIGWSVVLEGENAEARADLAKQIAEAAGATLTTVNASTLAGDNASDTKKNLDALFAGAGEHNAVLFFDEADALFGKRTNVTDSHDRYANLEVSYLLERILAQHDLVLIGTRKPPPPGNKAKALRDVLVRTDSRHASERGRSVPWTALCWPPR